MTRPHSLPVLSSKGLTLRPPLLADIEARRLLGRVPDVMEEFGIHLGEAEPISLAEAENWFDALVAQPMAWVIEHKGAMIGEILLHTLVPEDKRASMAIEIFDPLKLGKGIGPNAMHLLLGHAFENMGLHRVSGRVLADNTRAIVAYRKVGFLGEGRERQSTWLGNKWQDDVIMGVLRAEYVGPSG